MNDRHQSARWLSVLHERMSESSSAITWTTSLDAELRLFRQESLRELLRSTGQEPQVSFSLCICIRHTFQPHVEHTICLSLRNLYHIASSSEQSAQVPGPTDTYSIPPNCVGKDTHSTATTLPSGESFMVKSWLPVDGMARFSRSRSSRKTALFRARASEIIH